MTEPEPARRAFGVVLLPLATSCLLALAMPGRLGWWPLLFVALAPLLFALSRLGPRQSLWAGWLAGFAYHLCLLYWIVIVLGHYGGLPPVVSIPALLLLALYMGFYTGVFALVLNSCVRFSAEPFPGLALFLAPALWVSLDWLRSFLFSGFPWMDLGYGLYRVPLLLQVADLGGHHLVTFLLVMINSLLVYGLTYLNRRGRGRGRDRIAAACAVLLLLLAGVYSGLRGAAVQEMMLGGKRAVVAVVQGNIPQDEKWTPARKKSTVNTYLDLTRSAVGPEKPDLVVWPETALPFYPGNDPLFDRVTGLAREQQIMLLTGAPRFTLLTDLIGKSPLPVEYYNSALLIDSAGQPSGRYDKQHLVPFGEYVPLADLLWFLEPLVESVGNFSPGRSGEPMAAGEIRPGVLICFESIFPDLARMSVKQGANLLVNITNDAWYGRSSAPYQSFAMSVLRAVETRRTLVRAANTGISGFVSPRGEVVGRSPLFETYSRAASVVLIETRTLFVRFGHLFAPLCLALSLLFIGICAGKRR